MRFRKGREEEARLGIAPLIDIVFLLLIFFMVTSHFDVASGVRITLPKVSRNVFQEEGRKIMLVIDKSGQIYLEQKKIETSALLKSLEDLLDQEKITHLILQADRNVAHGKVVEMMDIAKAAGVPSIVIAARWKADKVF